MALHPNQALTGAKKLPPLIPSCVHYAGSERFIRKAFEIQDSILAFFDICCDLEDGAARGAEEQHLHRVISLIRERSGSGGRLGVRIHGPDSSFWKNDLQVLLTEIGTELDFITVPKVESALMLSEILEHAQKVASKADLYRVPPFHVLIETQTALREVWAIATLPGLEALEFGMMDYVSDHHGAIPEKAMQSPEQFEHPLLTRARTEISAAAIANGLVSSHNICLKLEDAKQTFSDAKTAREKFGCQRMWSIHPAQIEPIVRAFAPDLEAVKKAGQVLLAAQKAEWGPIKLGGSLFDRASYRIYWHLLQRARLEGIALAPEVDQAFFPAA